jgi:hypothetical protein
MKLLLYGAANTKVKTFELVPTWEKIAELIFSNTDYEDDVFVVLDNNDHILYRGIYDTWKEEQFLNFNGVRIEL